MNALVSESKVETTVMNKCVIVVFSSGGNTMYIYFNQTSMVSQFSYTFLAYNCLYPAFLTFKSLIVYVHRCTVQMLTPAMLPWSVPIVRCRHIFPS